MSADQKQILRKHCRQTREALGESFRQRAGLEICALIEAWPVFQQARVILTYMPIKNEVDLRPLLERQPHKEWALPRIIPEADHAMFFHPYIPGRLVRHPYGMDEPAEDLPVLPPGSIDLALVPGLAYDREGWRLGYGGGYYDRFLRNFHGVSLGVTFEALLLESLPRGDFDLPVDWVVSDAGIFQPNI